MSQYNGIMLKQNEYLPTVPVYHIPLQPNEVCHFVGTMNYIETKEQIVGYTGGHGGFNFRVMKGVTFRTGNSKSTPIKQNVTTQYPGTLTVTNKRIIFSAEKGSFNAKLDKIVSIQPHVDGLEIQINSKTYPLLGANSVLIYQIIMSAIQGQNYNVVY